jgi:hydroxymethylpyrimidine pyrophosphatase-like HAD family hydrolase
MHGFRVLLTTGRSLGEVKERCAAYHLSGGVAEYGAALYEHVSGQVRVLLSADEQGLLNKVRGRLSNKPGIYLDNDYRFAIRAYCLDEYGERMRLENETVEQIFVESGAADRVYAIQGDHQTDFMVKRLDKGVGLRAWLVAFSMPGGNTPNHRVIEMAVGDSASDLPMFSLARQAFAPASASGVVKQAGVHVTARPHQRGLEQAVARLVGHTPGGCMLCRHVTLPPQTAFMQDLLSVQENGQWGMLWKAIRLLAMRGGWNHVRA